MNKTKIDWCDSTFNPVTGCCHYCEYCYAKKIAERFGKFTDHSKHFHNGMSLDPIYMLEEPVKGNPYPYLFNPTFHRYRLNEPARITKPRNIFVCSMADLFGEWVPDEWIEDVFAACEAAPQHRYLFLTKNPKRYQKTLDRYFPPNMWFGWSQTGPIDNELGFSTHHSVKTFISLEPLLTPFEVFNIRGIDWAIVGAETGNRKGKVIPEREWIESIVAECRKYNVPIFMKSNLRSVWGDELIQEYPWEDKNEAY